MMVLEGKIWYLFFEDILSTATAVIHLHRRCLAIETRAAGLILAEVELLDQLAQEGRGGDQRAADQPHRRARRPR